MGKKRSEWILAAALLLAVDLLMLLAGAVNRTDWGELVMRGLETAVFLGILGVAVRGFYGMAWRGWLWTGAMSVAGMFLELLSWNIWNWRVTPGFSVPVRDRMFILTGEMLTGFLILAAMALFLHRDILKNRSVRLRTFGWLERWICPALMIFILSAGMFAQWYQADYSTRLHEQRMRLMQTGDPMVILGTLVAAASSSRLVWPAAVYRACCLLLKALFVWVMACGVLGFADKDRTETGRAV